MKSVHLTILLFCQVLLASVVFYLAQASPLVEQVLPQADSNIKVATLEQKYASEQSAYQNAPDSPLGFKTGLPSDGPAQPQRYAANSQVGQKTSDSLDESAAKKNLETQVKAKSGAESDAPNVSNVGTHEFKSSQTHSIKSEDKVELLAGRMAPISPKITKKEEKNPDKYPKEETMTAKLDAPITSEQKSNEGKEVADSRSITSTHTDGLLSGKTVSMLPQPAALVAHAKPEQTHEDKVQSSKVEAKIDTVVIKESAQPEAPVKKQQYLQQAPMVARSGVESKIVEKNTVAKVAKSFDEKPQAKSSSIESVGKVESQANEQSPKAKSDSANIVQQTSPTQQMQQLSPVVMGGLGPLHLLATSLCKYQPDKATADESLKQLYARRLEVRKSLFDFMNLKFTNLEKLSARLGEGLPVQSVPVPTDAAVAVPKSTQTNAVVPSNNGWPIVGKCTAHDLKLMGEAAWCGCETELAANCAVVAAPAAPPQSIAPGETQSKGKPVDAEPKATRSNVARALSATPEQASVVSKTLNVDSAKGSEISVVESKFYHPNLANQQPKSAQPQARDCRRNALVYTKALFYHLAEDQHNASESWPKLYDAIAADDCARKRMLDVVAALSTFRTDTTSIRRDNLEFAFATDDLRAKVLETDVNCPLTFDKQFIEVEQFLQQSVRLMLSNIDPNRAKLTSMRYRSLMYGSTSDDECVELHQRLMMRPYPSDCNPNQFGQLMDVLRMTASSLELWSIEKDIRQRTVGGPSVTNAADSRSQQRYDNVEANFNECISNLIY